MLEDAPALVLQQTRFTRRQYSATVEPYPAALSLELEGFNSTFYMHLRPNDHLLHTNATVTIVPEDEQDAVTYLLRDRMDGVPYWGMCLPV